jgi:hypothetical protein
MAITVTNVRVASHSGENKLPGSGSATFSDGKTYEWCRLPPEHCDEAFALFTWARVPGGGSVHKSFRSPARIAALVAYFDA